MKSTRTIREEAAAMGFSALRFATLPPDPVDLSRYRAWLADGFHAGMGWMERHLPLKERPQALLPSVRSVAVMAVPYGLMEPPAQVGLAGRVARYAWSQDYHDVLGARVRRLAQTLVARLPGLEVYPSVDAQPVFERAWAHQAGLGFSGKNTSIIVPGMGSWCFLVTLLLSIEVDPDPPLTLSCGTCRRCLAACPTGALVAPGRLDARRCLSFLTIEHAGDLPDDIKPLLGARVYGCDTCHEACPWNGQREPAPLDQELVPKHTQLDLAALLATDEPAYKAHWAGTPLRRSGILRLQRNACIALGNLADAGAVPLLRPLLLSPSALLRRHAAWALLRLGAEGVVRDARNQERDALTIAAMDRYLDSTA